MIQNPKPIFSRRRQKKETERIIFTKEGYAEKEKEYALLLEKRPTAVAELRRAREMGDLSENGAYKAARFELTSLDRQLRHLKRLLDTGIVVVHAHDGTVSIGSTVTIEEGEKESVYAIVGGYESDPTKGKISHMSPIGKALLGKKVNDVISIHIPSGTVTYKILSIS